tara:strand:- start:68 stop:715 length:648 start_codon:yes stop_codon:yes gene_type:complete
MLAALAKTLEPTAVFDRSSLSHQFSEKFPIITLDLSEIASKLIEDYQKLTVNENLERQILEYGDKQQRKTNVKAHMTDWFMQDSSQEFQWVCNRAIDLAAKNNPHQVDMMAYDCWGAIYREGDRTIMHNHWPHLWSFVYYVKCPDSSAPLMFDRCIQPNGTIQRILPKTSLMVLFPGWVNHSVPEHSGKDRIVVAGNLSINPFSHIKTIEDRELG